MRHTAQPTLFFQTLGQTKRLGFGLESLTSHRSTLAVFGIRKLSIDYVKYMAVAAGAILMLVVHIIGSMLLDITLSYGTVLFGCVLSALIAVLIVFWCGQVDYSRPEYLQFEDDEYIYYVKAVPKIVMERPEKELMRISGRDSGKEQRQPAGRPAE